MGCHLCSKKMDFAEINQAQLPERPDENAVCPSSISPWEMIWWSQGAASPPLSWGRAGLELWVQVGARGLQCPAGQEPAQHHRPFPARAPTEASAWLMCPIERKQMEFFFRLYSTLININALLYWIVCNYIFIHLSHLPDTLKALYWWKISLKEMVLNCA